ncbi:UNVERIFIED_CONTAM: hypothetical protein FKN15_001461 [Acipenser sinensis]
MKGERRGEGGDERRGGWACGVIMFTLLAGSPPFWHRKQMLMLRMIMEGRYSLDTPEWDDRSDNVKDLGLRVQPQLLLYGRLQPAHLRAELRLDVVPQLRPRGGAWERQGEGEGFSPVILNSGPRDPIHSGPGFHSQASSNAVK